MKITRIATESFRGLPDGERTFGTSTTASPLTVVDGPPGSGKSSLLLAIAVAKELVGAYGLLPSAESLLRKGRSSGRIEATWELTDAEMGFVETDQRVWNLSFDIRPGAPFDLVDPGLRRLFASHPTRTPDGCGGLELFDASRELSTSSRRGGGEERELEVRAKLGRERYAGLTSWLVRRMMVDGAEVLDALDRGGMVARWDRADALSEARSRLRVLLPHLHLARVEPRAGAHRLVFASRDGLEIDVDELSDGERARVLIALSFLRFSLDHGVVLIDDVDLRQAPEERGELLRALTALGRDVQLVVTSRCRVPAASMPSHHAILLGTES